MRRFNVTGLCVPDKHYMADTSEKIKAIMQMVEQGDYFSINQARQYGKTTTLSLLDTALSALDYTVINISFESTSDDMDQTEAGFCQGFLSKCEEILDYQGHPDANVFIDNSIITFELLRRFLTKICKGKKYVLMVDEVDKSSNNIIYLKFLGVLRDKYLRRSKGLDDTFHSVILAGVYNIKNLKIKMINAGTHLLKDGEQRMLSPWNIAADFIIDMSLNEKEISSMLGQYENDHYTGMDIENVAKEIRNYTNGYPYLVSRICQKIDNELNRDWSAEGVQKAIKLMLGERTTLVDDIAKNLHNNVELNNLLYSIIAFGEQVRFTALDNTIELGLTFGFLLKQGDWVVIGNKFFEMLLYNHYIEKKRETNNVSQKLFTSDVVKNNQFDMQRTIEKFALHYYELYREKQKKFIEDECRMLFLTFLSPLINGGGFCHIESETRDKKRMDLVVDYGAEQFIIELKLWYGEASHEEALDQLVGYLDSKNKDLGYLVTFDFRQTKNTGKPKGQWIQHQGKKIFDVMAGIAPIRKIKK